MHRTHDVRACRLHLLLDNCQRRLAALGTPGATVVDTTAGSQAHITDSSSPAVRHETDKQTVGARQGPGVVTDEHVHPTTLVDGEVQPGSFATKRYSQAELTQLNNHHSLAEAYHNMTIVAAVPEEQRRQPAVMTAGGMQPGCSAPRRYTRAELIQLESYSTSMSVSVSNVITAAVPQQLRK